MQHSVVKKKQVSNVQYTNHIKR